MKRSGYSAVKSLFDFLASLVLLIMLSPVLIVLLLLGVAVYGHPIFTQKRIGYRSRPFVIYKFRTMRGKDPILNRYGAWLRSLSLDELPQLVNVIFGNMSLIGPRPLLPEYLPLYSVRQSKRHEVKPGITGWAQVKGRNNLTWQEQFELDVWYVEHQNFLQDIRIAFLTIAKLFRSKPKEVQIREPFKGNEG